jgi:hypothetical protein
LLADLRFGGLVAPRELTARDRGLGAERAALVRVREEGFGFDPVGRRPRLPFADVATRQP